MLRCLACVLPIALVALTPARSWAAAGEDCPDGWFCDPNAEPEPAPASPPLPPPPPPGPEPNAVPARPAMPPAYAPPGYAPPGYPQLEVPEDNPPAKRRRAGGFREWGFNLHLAGALHGNESERVSNMALGGLGFAFRYRLMPPLAFEAGVDLLTTSDDHGDSRKEASLSLNALVFFNPHDVAQVYAVGGMALSGAVVTVDGYDSRRPEEHFSYFGGQLGLGLEVRVSRRLAVGGDLLGFIRGRTDSRWDDKPEFVQSNLNDVKSTSSGGLLRVGVTFYW